MQTGRYLLSRDAGRKEETAERVGRLDRPMARSVRVQFQEDLAVLKPVRQHVGDVHRERGLPHPRHAVDGMNGNDAAWAWLRFNRLDQTRQFLLAARKSDSVAWQCSRRGRDSAAV